MEEQSRLTLLLKPGGQLAVPVESPKDPPGSRRGAGQFSCSRIGPSVDLKMLLAEMDFLSPLFKPGGQPAAPSALAGGLILLGLFS